MGLLDFLKNIIFSEDFLSRHRKSPKDFTRKRSLPFHTLIFFLLNLNKGSYQDELDNYFKVLNHLEVAERIVTKGALSKARKKLKYEAFVELNDHMIHKYYSNFQTLTWNGFNLLAVDGTTIRVPDEPEIAEHFGVWNSRQGKQTPKARGSQLFDVLNKITIDAILSPKKEGERELAAQHFIKLLPNDLILLDRGYPAYWLFNLILSMDANFCARVSCKKWKIIRKFYESGEKEMIVKLDPTPSSYKKCNEMGLDKKPIKVRLIRVELDTGETEVLITSLLDIEHYPAKIFHDLYHSRWPVEEDYKIIKRRLDIENFSGKSKHSVYQDFYAKIMSKNLTSIIVNTTRNEVDEISEGRNSKYQINFTQALSKMKSSIVLLFNRPSETLKDIVSKLQDIFIKTLEQVRPGRKFKRKHKIQTRIFYVPYKQIC
jgi:hypothetical protein